MAKNTAVFGIFHDRISVEKAADALKSAGFRNTDISVLYPDNTGSKDFAHEKHSKAPEVGSAGAATGALLGGTLGWLMGLGSLSIPGVGPLVAAGPILSALACLGIGGAVGGVTGAVIGMGIPEYEAKRYEGLVKDGGILMSVHCDNSEWANLAKEIFFSERGDGIAATSEDSNVVKGTATDRPFYKGPDHHRQPSSLASR